MKVYYNEFDDRAVTALMGLMRDGLIPQGEIDTRSIIDVRAADLSDFDQCHFFAGIGGWSAALERAKWPTSRPVWTGSCPCQPFSSAGAKKGMEDARHLLPVFQSLIRECTPPVVFGEQVERAIEYGWLDEAKTGFEAIGYSFGNATLSSDLIEGDDERKRIWFVADTSLPDDPRNSRAISRKDEQEPSQMRQEERVSEPVSADGTRDWGNAARHLCSDGITRRIPTPQSGIFVLADEIPEAMVLQHLVGNAINVDTAAFWIETYMQVRGIQ